MRDGEAMQGNAESHRHPNGKIQPMPDPRMATRLRLRRTRQTPSQSLRMNSAIILARFQLRSHNQFDRSDFCVPGWSPQCGKGDERRAADLVVGRTDQSELRTTCHTSPDHDTSGQTSLHVLLADTELINQDPATD
ncbi:uncharacterized protein PGTG_02179 [Puccinia graminis f. sp. tritici CRL 75-36-700-3]|uniref:Uncharacterized protein n=1 Tax=Puccinia graminis f. sp. tritici (strain CRL 75-36-700-3 / race SCCL) TaxID=418459 RepID=E3JXE3_PUCGT|nr:uncharacterized protein PGTG_02179 [Puccinia graminis f. sp. tritici CRL 75-36-700-3]EFP76718.1 hypothetical protein PGTG_02179 [Puccinia graminis f. sp. tritici CRL 75-36-700-3]